MNKMFTVNFLPIRDSQKGYGATEFDWIDHTKINYSELQCGPCEGDIFTGADPIYEQLWPFLNKIVANSANTITPLLEISGVMYAHKFPFWGKIYS